MQTALTFRSTYSVINIYLVKPRAGEKRELGVFLGTTYERQGALPGKW